MIPQPIMKRTTLRSGDFVEIRAPEEILLTLDIDGTLDQLPFMPEMVEFCGKRFRVAKRVVKTCSYTGSGTNMRRFRADDVFTLEDIRCSGAEHDGCPKACMIFWREAWLRKVEDAAPRKGSETNTDDSNQLRARLKTRGPKVFFCQASELLEATGPLARRERLGICFSEVRCGNCTAFQMVERIGIWIFWKARRMLLGAYSHGHNQLTPAASLKLNSGELVEVKSIGDIRQTLNRTAHNRGLFFSPDMRLLCGKQQRVFRKLDKIIVDGTGEMRQMENTLYLEGSRCDCPHVAFGGCSRNEFVYWREIWLRRLSGPRDSGSS